MVSEYETTAEIIIEADTPIRISFRFVISPLPMTSSMIGLTEYGRIADDALLITISTNPIKIVLRLGQIMVLNTLAIDIFGFFFAMMEVELKMGCK